MPPVQNDIYPILTLFYQLLKSCQHMRGGERGVAGERLHHAHTRVGDLIGAGLAPQLQSGFQRLKDTTRAQRETARFVATHGRHWQAAIQRQTAIRG